MNIDRYDIEAGRNVLTMLRKVSPADYEVLMVKLKTNAGFNGALGVAGETTEESSPGFWERIFEVGTGALTTIVDYKLQEQTAKAQQDQYEIAVQTEMERQAMLAARQRSQAMEYSNQMEYVRQQAELEKAASRAKSTMNWALIAVGGLVGLFILGRVLA